VKHTLMAVHYGQGRYHTEKVWSHTPQQTDAPSLSWHHLSWALLHNLHKLYQYLVWDRCQGVALLQITIKQTYDFMLEAVTQWQLRITRKWPENDNYFGVHFSCMMWLLVYLFKSSKFTHNLFFKNLTFWWRCLRTGCREEYMDLRKKKLTGGWRKFNNNKFHNLYSSQDILKVIMKETGKNKYCSLQFFWLTFTDKIVVCFSTLLQILEVLEHAHNKNLVLYLVLVLLFNMTAWQRQTMRHIFRHLVPDILKLNFFSWEGLTKLYIYVLCDFMYN
jgi:hypothetical protein